jgi:beta-phosphoglucomutase
MAAWEAWSRVHAPHATPEYFRTSFGLRNDAIIGGLLDHLRPEEMQRLAERKEELFRDAVRGRLLPLPGVAALLDFLDEHAIPRAIVTSTPRMNLDLVLETLGFQERFGALVAEEDAARGKPDPEGFLIAAQRLDVAAGHCIVIEDAPAGIDAARAAGMRSIAVTTTRGARELSHADLVVDSLEDRRVRQYILQRAAS